MKALRQHGWVALPPGSGPRTAFEQFFLRDGQPLPPTVNIVSSSILLVWMLQEQPWLALLPLSVAAPFLRAKLLRRVNIPVEVEVAPLGLATRHDTVEGGTLLLRDFLRASAKHASEEL
jgi:DNA-binding transcriptional LysR family regulator